MFERPQHSLRELIQFSPLAIEELDPEGKVKLWNTAAEQMFGWRESEVLGRAYPAIPAESRAEFEDEMRHVLKGATIQSKLVRRQRQDGRQFDARLWAAPIHNQRNQVIGITKILEDVTPQKAAEEHLLLQSTVLQATANSIVITDDQGTILWTNPAFSQLTGYGSEEVLGKNPRLLKSGKQDSAFYTNMWATITSGNVWHGEVVNRKKDGSLYNEEMTITPVHISNGGITHYVAVKQDVTLRRVAEEALRQAEMQYRFLFENNPLPMWVFDRTTLKFLAVNEAAIRHYGFSRQEFLSMTTADIRPEEDIPRLLKATAQPIHGLREVTLWRHRKKNGSIIDVEIVSHELDFHGIQAELVAPRDVTERKKAERALRRSEEYLAFAQGITGVGSWVWDPSTTEILYWSQENYRIWDIEGAISFEKALERIHPEDRTAHSQAIEKAIREKTNFELDFRIIIRDGSIRYIRPSGDPIMANPNTSFDVDGARKAGYSDEEIGQYLGQKGAAAPTSESAAKPAQIAPSGEVSGQQAPPQKVSAIPTLPEAASNVLVRSGLNEASPAPALSIAPPPVTPASITPSGEPIVPLEAAQANPEAAVAPAAEQAATLGEINPRSISQDPARFQYKAGTDVQGTSSLLKEQDKYNPDLAGVITAWRDPADGKTYVVNGHQRLELALRTKAPSVAVRHINAKDATEARAIGALQNISEGRGTAVDAAKFMRDSGITPDDLKAKGISMGEATARNGVALANLDDSLFQRVSQGDIPEGRAVVISDATPDHAQQRGLLGLIESQERKGKRVTNDTIRELADFVVGSGTRTETTASLFGDQQIEKSLALEKAEVSAYVKQQLAKDRKLFGYVANEGRAAELQKVGNRLDTDKNRSIAESAQQAESVYDKLKTFAGPINKALQSAAEKLASGKDDPNAAKQEAYTAIRKAVSDTLAGEQGKGAGRVHEAPTLPGFENTAEQRASTLAGEQGQGLSQEAARAGGNISSAAGKMERESALFAGSEASGNRNLFESHAPERNSASVKAFITKSDEAKLRELNYTQVQIDHMTPEEAQGLLKQEPVTMGMTVLGAPEVADIVAGAAGHYLEALREEHAKVRNT